MPRGYERSREPASAELPMLAGGITDLLLDAYALASAHSMIGTRRDRKVLLRERADAFARVALANIEREFPHQELLLQTGSESLPRPRELHPAFYGSLDWHSCVEMHWVLARLLRSVPDIVLEAEIRTSLEAHLSADALAAEAQYFADSGQRTTERPYGWGWALALAAELLAATDSDAARWAAKHEAARRALRRAFPRLASRGNLPCSKRPAREHGLRPLARSATGERTRRGRGRAPAGSGDGNRQALV